MIPKYHTGAPCRYGHIADRFTSTGNCVECNRQRAHAFTNTVLRSGPVDTRPDRFLYAPITLRVHPDDHDALYTFVDHLNAARGRGPHPRPAKALDALTPLEVYLQAENVRWRGKLPFDEIIRVARDYRYAEEYGAGRDEGWWRRLMDGEDASPTDGAPLFVEPQEFKP